MPNSDGVLSAQEYIDLRAPIAQEHAEFLAAREKEYAEDKGELQRQFMEDVADIRKNWEDAYVAAGLHADGSDPSKQVGPPGSVKTS